MFNLEAIHLALQWLTDLLDRGGAPSGLLNVKVFNCQLPLSAEEYRYGGDVWNEYVPLFEGARAPIKVTAYLYAPTDWYRVGLLSLLLTLATSRKVFEGHALFSRQDFLALFSLLDELLDWTQTLQGLHTSQRRLRDGPRPPFPTPRLRRVSGSGGTRPGRRFSGGSTLFSRRLVGKGSRRVRLCSPSLVRLFMTRPQERSLCHPGIKVL